MCLCRHGKSKENLVSCQLRRAELPPDMCSAAELLVGVALALPYFTGTLGGPQLLIDPCIF